MGSIRKTYSKEFKLMVVKDYLSGKSGGLGQIIRKYDLPDKTMTMKWVKKYKESGENALSENRGKTISINRGRPRKSSLSLEDKVKRLEVENAYLRKIVEYRENLLKKKK